MKVTWFRDLASIFDYIAEDDPVAAYKIVARIRDVADLLATSPCLGRPGQRSRRYLSVTGLPYVIIYRVRGESVQIVAIFHTAWNRRL